MSLKNRETCALHMSQKPKISHEIMNLEHHRRHRETSAPGRVEGVFGLLDACPLECDGMTRVISTVMQRDRIDHQVHVGQLRIKGVGEIPHHWWIVLPDGRICDLRARMWLGCDPLVPHGLFSPMGPQQYAASASIPLASIKLSSTIFLCLTGFALESVGELHV